MFFWQLFLLLVSVWVIGRLFQRFKLPPIFGEILAGIIVGPVTLGFVEENEAIRILSELGAFFLMLHAGLETSPKDLFKASKSAFLVAIGGSVLPFVGGYYLSLAFGLENVQALFIGMGLSITSIAVSAKLFKDYGITKSKVAHISLGAAIIDDILGLILFSIIISIAKEGGIDVFQIVILTLKIIAFFGVVLVLGKKFFNQIHRVIYDGNKGFTFTIILALAFGLVAEFIGLHLIVGAFLAGLFIKEEVISPSLFHKIEDRVYGVSYSFLGPIFFASLAFHLDFIALRTQTLFTILMVLVAIVSKVLGAGIMAYFAKLKKTEALGVGFAMNSRGAVELIIALIGFEMGIIDKEILSILVIMAFATTMVSVIALKPLAKYFSNAPGECVDC